MYTIDRSRFALLATGLVSLEPLTGAAAPNIAAMIAQELAALAADAKTLAARLTTGDVVSAVVLPPNGLTDLLEIGGLRVAADLPPTLVPGQAISVMVSGFRDDRIELQIMPISGDSAGDAAPASPPSSPAPSRKADGASTLISRASELGNVRTAAFSEAPALPARTALPAAVLVAASRVARPLPSELHTIEARLAAAHATSAQSVGPPSGAAGGSAGAKPIPVTPGGPRPFVGVRTAPPLAVRPVVPPQSPPVARTAAGCSTPAMLLRALHLALTPANLTSARTALAAPQRLPDSLDALERALAANADGRLSTLRALTSFVARLDPRSPVFADQIAAFVDHVVTGSEAKLAQLVALPAQAPDSLAPEPEVPQAPVSGAAWGDPVAVPAPDRLAAARAALHYDLKTQLFELAANASGGSGDAAAHSAGLNSVVTDALTAISAIQLGAAALLDANPSGLTFALPVALPDGFAQARIHIDRDAPQGSPRPLDGDDFHLAFVLETRRLGTIAIDVLTVGRAVTLSVKTEAQPQRKRFSAAMGDLTARLEKLRYRVTRAEAVVAPAAVSAVLAEAPPAVLADPARQIDVDA